MTRRQTVRLVSGLLVLVAAFALAVGAPAFSSGAAGAPDAAGAIQALAAAPCAQTPQEAGPVLCEPLAGGSCEAESKGVEFMDSAVHGGRTCRCSCGYPCKTDADCGGGLGSCRAGISCC